MSQEANQASGWNAKIKLEGIENVVPINSDFHKQLLT